MAPICQSELDKWQDRIREWQEAYDAVDKLFEDAIVAELAAAAMCGGAIFASATLVGAVVGGGACAVAVARLVQAGNALSDGVDKANDKAARGDDQGTVFMKCLADHKKDP